jgi:uncharacterized Fe-S center protein
VNLPLLKLLYIVEYRDFVKSLKIFAISDHAGERGKGEYSRE